jgi:hypothetical protein
MTPGVNSSRLINTTFGYVIPLTSRYLVYQEWTQPTGRPLLVSPERPSPEGA